MSNNISEDKELDGVNSEQFDAFMEANGIGKGTLGYKFVTDYINHKLAEELEHILANSSGGGSWRRVITNRINQLKERSNE